MLKAFLPQLQSTFVKALSDPTADVRSRAAVALGKLMTLHSRVDPLVRLPLQCKPNLC
jgi:HEAT repeat protein